MDESRLASLKKQAYINVETFRKNGQGVKTPVWFVLDGATVYVRTGAQSGKVKRVRRDSHVRFAPSDGRGNPTGDWVEADASLADPATAELVNGLLKKKYGITKFLFDIAGRFQKFENATLVIAPRAE